MDRDAALWLAGPGAEVVRSVDPTADPLSGLMRLRAAHPQAAEDLLRSAWTLAVVRARHRERLGAAVDDWVLTDDLAQQATRPEVAGYRAARLRAAGLRRVVDATCGAGADTVALAAEGVHRLSIDIDPLAVACASVNAGVEVRCLDATQVDFRELDADAVLVDPARRSAAGPRSRADRAPIERDPGRWSPPWPWVTATSTLLPTIAKCAPGMPLTLVPPGADMEWVAVDGDVVEATVWFDGTATRRVAVLGRHCTSPSATLEAPRHASSGIVAGDPEEVPELLFEPHEAVRRAGLVDVLAAKLASHRLTERSEWLVGRADLSTPLGRTWQVQEWVPLADLRRALRGSGHPTFKTNDVGRPASEVARSVGHRAIKGAPGRTVVLLRDLRRAALVHPQPA